MSSTSFEVSIVTPEDVFFKGSVRSLVAPGFEGYLGILLNHAPLVTPLVKGTITAKLADGKEKRFETDGGFLEVSKNRVLMLVEKVSDLGAAAEKPQTV